MKASKQPVLKPQDMVLVLKLGVRRDQRFTYPTLAAELSMSASEAHAGLGRLYQSRLLTSPEGRGSAVVRSALLEFLIHGVKYCFPAATGPMTRGTPTSYAGPALRAELSVDDEAIPVWPHEAGTTRGVSLYPLYPSVPKAAERDPDLYVVLTLVDAIRSGAARERELAASLLIKALA
jgi:hypothetical protein